MIRPNDEHWQSNLQGTPYTTRLDRQIHERAQQETARYLLEEAKRTGILHTRMHETVALSILNSKGKIESVGINKPDDLILNNFGYWLAALIQPPTSWAGGTTYASTTLKDTANTSRTVATYANACSIYAGTFNYAGTAQNTGTYLQVGSGTTTAARADYNIETAFGTAPESGVFSTAVGSYAAGYISFSGAVTAGGSGTVNETGFFGKWIYGTPNSAVEVDVANFMLFHDNLETGQPFTAGQTINCSYSIDI